ncbi:MAG: hypothetical protein HY901_23710 [Deltaproteobacteria bacterium]|nr:hypothetical protein [Deltaproteobacteria bacterium]
MDPKKRPLFNAAWSPECFAQLTKLMEGRVGRVPFRVAETPLFVTPELRDRLTRSALEIVAQVSSPERVAQLRKAVPARYDMPGMDALPNTVQVDFALVEGESGRLEGQLIEMQGFPSLYALMPTMAECWAEVMRAMPGLDEPWSSWTGLGRERAVSLLRRAIVADNDPEHVVLVDIEPQKQKTRSDFVATQQMLGVEAMCVTQIKVEGRKLFREKDGRRVPIKRIYNRMVFDELEVKKVPVPFRWTDELDVTWCSHPNWYWTWSKYCLPFLDHPAVPQTRFLSEIEELPEDLSGYVLKPLFSFAGSGVVVDVTPEAIAAVPAEQRSNWVLMRKIEYAPALLMPDGKGVKVEVRVMLVRPPDEPSFTSLLCLVRLSRGKMIGVDHNKDTPWTGGSVGMWPEGS